MYMLLHCTVAPGCLTVPSGASLCRAPWVRACRTGITVAGPGNATPVNVVETDIIAGKVRPCFKAPPPAYFSARLLLDRVPLPA